MHGREIRASESSEQRELRLARLEQIRVHGREIRTSEGSEQREARLEQIRVHGREIRVGLRVVSKGS